MQLQIDTWRRRLYDIIPVGLWMGLIFYLSSRSVLIEMEDALGSTIERIIYKTAHALVYAILAWLWWRALTPDRQFHWGNLLAALALTVLYAISDEIHQGFVPGRHSRLADVLFDTSGALAMLLLLRRVAWLRTLFDSRAGPRLPAGPGRQTKLSEVNEKVL